MVTVQEDVTDFDRVVISHAFEATIRQAESFSGASSAVVNASGTLDAEASGASHLSYVGNPTLRSVNASGSSTVEEK